MPANGSTRSDRNRFVPIRQRDPLTYSGSSSEDVEEWLVEYDRVSIHNGCDESIKLASVIFYLTGAAKTWFENNENENDLQSWDAFRTAISDVFAVGNNRKRLFTERLASRSQHEGE